jgi:hypothetical protein
MTEANEDTPPLPAGSQPPPLAEGRWLWRRIYVFSVSLGLWGLLAGSSGPRLRRPAASLPTD